MEFASLLSPAESAEFREVVGRVEREPKAVLADPLDVVVLAGRPILLEPLIYSILLQQGRWDAESLAGRICAGAVGLVVLQYPIDSEPVGKYQGYDRWPAPVLTALRESMVLDRVEGERYLYVPRAEAAPATGGGGCNAGLPL